MKESIKGFVIAKGFELPKNQTWEHYHNDIKMLDYRLHKFERDEVLIDNDDNFMLLDGFVLNKEEIEKKQRASVWQEAYYKESQESNFPLDLRGGFAGVTVKKDEWSFFCDHMGNRALYYYCDGERIAVSSKWYMLVQLLQYNHVLLTPDEQAVKYMITHGFMLDETTFAKEIKRVLPGQKIIWKREIVIIQYYLFNNENIKKDMSEEEAIELIDFYFRQAVKREFEKDIEYNYKHLADLSGGLDSRMTVWVAHDMGYTDQINFTYCRKNYLDYQIAQDIAEDLKHSFLYFMLDDFNWIYDIDEICKRNNGAALYTGITGGNRFLSLLNHQNFGVEHTGMVGDITLSPFYTDEVYNYERPDGTEMAYSNKLVYNVSQSLLDRFANREQFALYTRGFLGAQSSYLIRQDYTEVSSPFLDVDFINSIYTIPFSFRKNHDIYLKWMNAKYPHATDFGWEKWYGVEPKEENANKLWWKKKTVEGLRIIRRKLGKPDNNSMNPYAYWMSKNPKVQRWMSQYYADNIDKVIIDQNIKKDMKKLFDEGNALEKTQVMTVIAMMKML